MDDNADICFAGDDDDDEQQEEDWTDTSWAQPTAHQQTSHISVIDPSKVGQPISRSKSELTVTGSVVEDPSVVKRMLLNDNKAGMEGLDKDKINQIIHEASKGSRFYENERKKEEEMKRKIEEQKQKIGLISETQLKQGLLEADRLLEDFEQQRDLSRTIVHIDMDAFYAAVEMRDNPSLKNKPMAVGGTAMLSTSNYHARKFGVRAAMPGFIGKKLCPDLIIMPLNFDKYTAVSKQVKSLLAEYDPNFCPMSLDEAYLDITEHLILRKDMSLTERTFICRNEKFVDSDDHCLCDLNDVCKQSGDSLVIMEDDKSVPVRTYFEKMMKESLDIDQVRPVCPICGRHFPPFCHVTFGIDDEEAVRELRTRIEQRTRLTASAGIAPNMMLSKVCSDKNKPNGQYKIQAKREAVMDFIKDLPTRKISGIGKVSEAMLNAVGVYTCTDLYNKRALLYHLYSQISFNYFMRICSGIGSTTVERTFHEISKPADLFKKCEELTESLVEDLKEEQLKGKTVSIKIKTVNFEVKTRAHSLPNYTRERDVILHAAIDLLKTEIQACSPLPLRLRLMGVRMSNLAHQSLIKDVKKQGTILGAFRKQSEKPKHTSEDSKVSSDSVNAEVFSYTKTSEAREGEDGNLKTEFLSCKTVEQLTSCGNDEQGKSCKNVEVEQVFPSKIGEQGQLSKNAEQGHSPRNLEQGKSCKNVEETRSGEDNLFLSLIPPGTESVVLGKGQEVNNNEKEQACIHDGRLIENTQLERVTNSGDNWKIPKVTEDESIWKDTMIVSDNMTDSNIINLDKIADKSANNSAAFDHCANNESGGRRNRSGLIRSNKKPIKKKRSSKSEKLVQYACPICLREITCASLNEFNEHVDECLEGKPETNWSVDTDVSEVENKQETCNTEVTIQSVEIENKSVNHETARSNQVGSVAVTGENLDEKAFSKHLVENKACLTEFYPTTNREEKHHSAENKVQNDNEISSNDKSAISGSSNNHRNSESLSVTYNSHSDTNSNPEQTTCESDISVKENTNNYVSHSTGDKTEKESIQIMSIKNKITSSAIDMKSANTNCVESSHPNLPILPVGSEIDSCHDLSVIDSGFNAVCISDGNSEKKSNQVLTLGKNKVLESTETSSAVTSKFKESTKTLTAVTNKATLSKEIFTAVTSSNSIDESDLPLQTTTDAHTLETSNKIKKVIAGISESKFDCTVISSNETKEVIQGTFEPKAGCSWMADDIETTDATNSASGATSAGLLVCPVCNVEQRSADLNEFNSHVDSCLSKGAISEILKEQKEVNCKSLKRDREAGMMKTPGSSQPSKKRKTVLPNKPPSCKTILSFFKDTQSV